MKRFSIIVRTAFTVAMTLFISHSCSDQQDYEIGGEAITKRSLTTSSPTNIRDYIYGTEESSSYAAFLKSYEEADGQNILLNQLGDIANNDSNYLCLLPSNEAWDTAYAKVKEYFEYPEYIEDRDYLQQLNAGIALIKDLTFNMSAPENADPTRYLYSHSDAPKTITNPLAIGGPLEGLFYNKETGFSGDGVVNCTNGQIIPISQWPYNLEELVVSPHFYAATDPDVFSITEGKESASTLQISSAFSHPEEIFGEGFTGVALIVPSNNNSRPDVTFKLRNLFKTTYDVGVIIASPRLANPDFLSWNWNDKKVTTFTFQLTYYLSEGTKKTTTAVRNITTHPERTLDTIWVQKGFEVPVCSYGITNDERHTITAEIVITSRYRETTGKPNEGTSNSICLAGLIVKPTEKSNEESE